MNSVDRPSNPIVAGQAPRSERENHLSSLRMRLQTVGDVPPLPAEEALWLLEELNKLEDEIERLTRELVEKDAEHASTDHANWNLRQERDRLRAAIEYAAGVQAVPDRVKHKLLEALRPADNATESQDG